MKEKKALQELEAQLKTTQLRLEEAEETLQAIRNNEVDALVIEGPQGQQVFTLQGAEQPYRTLMETMSEGALTVVSDGTILYCNSYLSELVGMPLNKIIGTSFYDFVISRSGQSFEVMLKACVKDDCRGEFLLKTANRGEAPVSLSARPLMVNDVDAFCIVATDLTEQKRAQEALKQSYDHLEDKVAERTAELSRINTILREEVIVRKRVEDALRESEERYRNFVKYAPAAIYEMDLQGTKFLSVNDVMCGILGYSREELLSIRPVDLLDEKSKSFFKERVRNKLTGESIEESIEYRIRRRDGKWIQTAINVGAYTYSHGEPTRVVVIGYDITERRRAEDALREARDELETRVRVRTSELSDAYETLQKEIEERKKTEEQLIRAQKLEALGTFAGGIAHDFNNVLAGIIGFTEMVMEDILPGSPEHRKLELVLKGGKRGRDLVRQILTFSRQSEQNKRPLAVSEIVEEGLKLLRPMLPSTIEISSKSLTNNDRIFADPVQMHQVLMNLAANAAYAMREKGGTMELCISNAGFTEKDPMPFSDMVPGEYVVLSARDTGTGMTSEVLDRIFDPFFTTKKQGEGTGLGLSVVHGIVQSHSGYVTVESEPGKGTAFHVYLPTIAEHTLPEGREAPVAAGGKEQILFVDDEDMLVQLNEQRLTRLGYKVVTTTSSMEALSIFRKDPDAFDLVITDYTMPNLTGIDLAAALLKVKPAIPIILCTGHSQLVAPERAQEAGIMAILTKPVGRQELAQTLRRVLDGRE